MAVKNIVYNDEKISLAYEYLDLGFSKNALILHGWGANKELMKMALNDINANQIYLDLAGFGKSDEPKSAFDSIDYTLLVREFMKSFDKIDFIIGHSYGGKIAVLLTKQNLLKDKNDFIKCDDFDNDIKLILLSSAGFRIEKSFKVRFKIKLFKILKAFGLGAFKKAFVSDDAKGISEVMYQTFKNVVDEDISLILSKTSNKALLLWGESDTATPLKCANGFKSLLKNSELFVLEGDHFFFLKQSGKCVKLINDFINKA